MRSSLCWKSVWCLCLALGLGFAQAPEVVHGNAEEGEVERAGGTVVVCPVDGDILDGLAVLVDRAVLREAQDAKAIVFIIDTFGGRVDSAIDIANTILESSVPTVAYITGRGAISAGALIAYACDYIVMAPGVNIGASTPVMPGVEVSDQMNEKSMSFLRAKYRALGEENGHNPLIGEAMVDPGIELYGRGDGSGGYVVYKVERSRVVESHGGSPSLGAYTIGLSRNTRMQPGIVEDVLREVQDALRQHSGTPPEQRREAPEGETPFPPAGDGRDIEGLPEDARLISAAGSLLTLTTREAREIGLIRYTADSPEKALHFLGFVPFHAVYIEMTWAEALFAFLTSPLISGLLLLCGVGGLYVEFRTPGLGLPGLIGATCLALFFGSRLIIGVADWLDLLLVGLGITLLAVEVFVLPGFGLAGVSGILCLVTGLYLSLMRVPIPQYTWDFDRLRDAGTTLTVTALLLMLFGALTWKVFPRTRLARGLVLADAQSVDSGYVVQTAADRDSALGLRGKAMTMLRPAGRGRFGGTTYDIMTQGEYIDAGCSIEIIEAEGNRYVVRALESEDSEQ